MGLPAHGFCPFFCQKPCSFLESIKIIDIGSDDGYLVIHGSDKQISFKDKNYLPLMLLTYWTDQLRQQANSKWQNTDIRLYK